MKNIFLSSLFVVSLSLVAGTTACTASDSGVVSVKTEKSMKCGTGKCGEGKVKTNVKVKKETSKCGTGKCGEGKVKKVVKKAVEKCGTGKCGGGK